MTTAVTHHGLNLGAFAKASSTNAVNDFLTEHYSAIQCAAFHSKASSGQALLPGRLRDQSIILHQLLAVQDLVESLLKSQFSVSLPQSGIFHTAFGGFLSALAPMTKLLISVSDCPTVEQMMANEENLPEGCDAPVRFDGLNGDLTDQWLFVSENKPETMEFSKIGSFRLVAPPNTDIFLGPIADKMNRTLLKTDLDLEGISKAVIRIRCILRNLETPKRGFAH